VKRNHAILICAFLFALIATLAAPSYGQNMGSLGGQVTDPSGAAVATATVEITNTATNATRGTQSDAEGSYAFTQLTPGTYTIKVTKNGFKSIIQGRVSVLVATPTRLDFRLELGAVTQQVTVESAAAPTINTQDATVGNTFNEQEIKDLPILARNIVNLLTIQPGVVFTGMSNTDELNMGSISSLDGREGVVDGIRGNQSDVTLDGVDSNDWQNQSAFTSALPVTLDSVQEFRVTTTNANATNGLSGGAQVQMVTKSGTNDFHGAVYWYYRTTGTSANAWFNNDNGVGRPKLQRQQPGGALGGPIKKNRAYFFLNNEERRDSTGNIQLQDVPSDSLRDGALIYQCSSASSCPGGTVQGITASHTVAPGYYGIPATPQSGVPISVLSMDPAGIGVNSAMVPYMNLYPHGNDPSEGLDASGTGAVANFIGYRFNAPIQTFNNIYIARLDYNITTDGHHSLFWRGTMQGLKTNLVGEQFPGESAAQNLLNNSRGYVVQYQGQLSPTLINTARYGYTREGIALSGTSGASFDVRSFTDLLNYGTRLDSRVVPVHEINDDLSKTSGLHTFTVGGVLRIVTNDRVNASASFPAFDVNDGFCPGCADPANAIAASSSGLPAPLNPTAITRSLMMLTAPITQVNATFFGNPSTGAIQPIGSPDTRGFAERSFEVYGQDSWRMRSNLTLTFGLRYGYETPVWETNGLEVAPNVNIMSWFKQRVTNMDQGLPSSLSPLLSWVPAGKANKGANSWYAPDYKNFAPRFALAYSPSFDTGIGNKLFGGAGMSSIRVGAGVFYDNIGQPIAVDSDLNGSPGTATALINPSQEFCLGGADCPTGTIPATRFAGTCSLAAACTGLPSVGAGNPYFTVPTSATFPFTPEANVSNLGFAVDPGLRTPYSIHIDADIQRELPHHFVVDVGYVGTFGRRLLGKADFAQYLDIKDPKSGQDLWTAFQQIGKLANLTPTTTPNAAINPTSTAALQTIQDIPFFNNMLPNMPAFADAWYPGNGYASLTPTQAFYAYAVQDAVGLSGGPSWSCALFPMDVFVSPGGLPSPWNSTVDPTGTGFVLFTPQFSSLPGWTNWANSNYHSLQVSVRKSVGIVSFAANYVFSKSIDNASGAENSDFNGGTLNALIQNPFNHRLNRAVSDFNLRHNFNGDWVVDLPFGHGQHFFGDVNRVLDSVVGGWQLSGTVRLHSGFPESPGEGFNFPTNFFLTTSGTLTAPVKSSLTRHGANIVPNIFSNETAVYPDFNFTLPGLPGSRNVITGPAYAATDVAVSKSFRIWERGKLRLQARAYNVFNSVDFADTSLSLDPTSPGTFGNLTGTAGPRGGAREMEFAARFDF
jgi:hypothetical protein